MLSFTLSNVAFGSVDVGASSASQIVTVTNTGAAAISIVEIAVGGPNPASFVFANNCITSLAPGNTCTIHRHFAPTTTGPLTAYITVTSSPHSLQTITLTGTGVEPVVSLSASAIPYGSLTVNTPSDSQSVTLTNTGTAPLLITSIAVSGTNSSEFDFANNCPTNLAAGASCTIHGHFAPTTTGPMTAAVTVTSTAPGSPESFKLSGTGQ